MKHFFSRILRSKALLALAASVASLAISGCSDDSSSSRQASIAGYMQFYNASQNSPTTRLVVTNDVDASLTEQAVFGDASSLIPLYPATYTLAFSHTDPSDSSSNLVIQEQEITVAKDDFSLWLMTGDFTAPTFVEYEYTPPTRYETGKFGATAFNLTEGRGQLELYYAAEEGSFENATFLATFSEGAHSEPVIFAEGNYRFFVVDVDSGDRILTTGPIPFARSKTYFLMLRELGYGDGSTVVLDQVSGSSFVYSYQDQLNPAAAKVRAYNSIASLNSVDVILASDTETNTIAGLLPSTLSATQDLTGGDYDVALTAAGDPDNEHYAQEGAQLAPGSSAILFFVDNVLEEDETEALRAFLLPQNQRARLYEADVNYFNLALKQIEVETTVGTVLQQDPLTLYFVNEDAGEVFKVLDDDGILVIAPTAKYKLSDLSFGSQRNFSMLAANYVLYLTYATTESVTNDDATVTTVTTLHQFGDSLPFNLQAGDNYLLTLEEDVSATDGYRLKVSQ